MTSRKWKLMICSTKSGKELSFRRLLLPCNLTSVASALIRLGVLSAFFFFLLLTLLLGLVLHKVCVGVCLGVCLFSTIYLLLLLLLLVRHLLALLPVPKILTYDTR